jgi:hypothetical protein
MNLLNLHKAPGHNLIVTTVLKNLPRKAVLLITYIYIYIQQHTSPLPLSHSVEARSNRHDIQTGKSPTQVTSYRPVSLLPVMANIFERLLLSRIE